MCAAQSNVPQSLNIFPGYSVYSVFYPRQPPTHNREPYDTLQPCNRQTATVRHTAVGACAQAASVGVAPAAN